MANKDLIHHSFLYVPSFGSDKLKWSLPLGSVGSHLLGNCNKFYFTFGFDILMWDQIYQTSKETKKSFFIYQITWSQIIKNQIFTNLTEHKQRHYLSNL